MYYEFFTNSHYLGELFIKRLHLILRGYLFLNDYRKQVQYGATGAIAPGAQAVTLTQFSFSHYITFEFAEV